jgi:DNA-binding transcriptional ArsR family regulator
MPFAQDLTTEQRGKRHAIVTPATEAIVTGTATRIVTALENGPASARELSQRLDGVGYANIRQTLRRLSQRGAITKAARGLYSLAHCDTAAAIKASGSCHDDPARASVHCNSAPAKKSATVAVRRYTDAQIDAALRGAWEDYRRAGDIYDEIAWA